MSTIKREYWRYYGQVATAALSAANTFTAWVPLFGPFNLSISGTWSGTLTLQYSFDGGTTVLDAETHTANALKVGDAPEAHVVYRIGFKTGDFTSGTANVRLSQ